MRKKVIMSMTIDAELARRVEDMADAQRVSRSALLERLVRESLDQESQFLGMLGNDHVREFLSGMLSNPKLLMGMATAGSQPVSKEKAVMASRILAEAGEKIAESVGGRERKKSRAGYGGAGTVDKR
ncbi:MAG: ribbon-helix-helix protein, CopG family [Tepidisphaeraceae bacterium]|jgi:hypothetical protein